MQVVSNMSTGNRVSEYDVPLNPGSPQKNVYCTVTLLLYIQD
jgi:hypothetical protein